MKMIYTIGRDPTNDICVVDTTMMVSRSHAILRVRKNGHYTIFDQSTNGTYINGMRISPGLEVPVSRRDTINFAHVADLDWDLIPDSRKRLAWIILGILGVLLVLAGIAFGIMMGIQRYKDSLTPPPPPAPPVSQVDTLEHREKNEPVVAPDPEPVKPPVRRKPSKDVRPEKKKEPEKSLPSTKVEESTKQSGTESESTPMII